MSALLARSSKPPGTRRTSAREPAVLQSLLTAPCWASTSSFRAMPPASALPGSKACPNAAIPPPTASATTAQAAARRSGTGRLPTADVQRRGHPEQDCEDGGPDDVLAERQRHADDGALQQVGAGAGHRREPGQGELLGCRSEPAQQ